MFDISTPLPQNAMILVPVDQLLQEIDNRFTQRINEKQETDLQAQWLSPEKTRKLFDPEVSLVTLNKWAADGLLNKHFIGGRTYYKYCEVMEAVKTLKRYHKKVG